MKKLRMGVLFALVIAALLLSLNLITSAVDEKERKNDDALKTAQDQALLYKEQITELEKRLDDLESEQYVSNLAYEEKITELEMKLNAQDAQQTDQTLPQSDAKYTYTVSPQGITITGYKGTDKKLTIPKSIDGVNIISIGREAFKGATFEEIVIQDGLEKIDWFAFSDCFNLEDVTIPASVKKIEYGAFNGVKDFEIHCDSNSYAHKYAKSYGYKAEIN